MADGSPVLLPIYAERDTPDSAILSMEIARVVVSGDTDNLDVNLRLDSDDSDAAVALVEVPNQTFIYDVGWKVATAFDSNCIFTLGDCNDAAGWGASGDIEATATDGTINWAGQRALHALEVYAEAIDDRITAAIGSTNAVDTIAPVSTTVSPAYGWAGGKYIGDDTTVVDTFAITLTVKSDPDGPDLGNLEVYVKFARVWGRNRRTGVLAEGATT